MHCENCGAVINEGEKFCSNCGKPVEREPGVSADGFVDMGGVAEGAGVDGTTAGSASAGVDETKAESADAVVDAAEAGSAPEGSGDQPKGFYYKGDHRDHTGSLDGQNGQRSNAAGFDGQNGQQSNSAGFDGQNGQQSNSTGFDGQNGQQSNAAGFDGQNGQQWQAQGFTYQAGGQYQVPPYQGPLMPLRTDRSLVIFILLSFITCGIYYYIFVYQLAKDVNTACYGDGEETPGLLAFFLLSLVTCGIYSYVWFYKLGERLSRNMTRYGMPSGNGGVEVLLWMLLGLFLCGIGPFVGWYIIINNTNMVCGGYNRASGIMG